MKCTILIATADRAARSALQGILEQEGYDIVQAESGEQALALATAVEVGIFLLDLQMSSMHGLVVCQELRENEQYRDAPIIFLAGNSDEAVLEQALATGGDDFIQKPYTRITVRTRIRTHVQRLQNVERLERVRQILGQYLSKRTLDAIENPPGNGVLPMPEERDLAICFTDMRGFTAFSEATEPVKLFSLVSELLADQVNIIHDYGGYVDKFGGDGVMAIFDGPDMVLQSCLCALSILESARLKDSRNSEQVRRVGIGIHTGRAVVGNIGSPEHLDYSAIGSTVNLAARLCGQAEATSIAVSKAVHDAVSDDPRLVFHSERQVPIRGLKDPVTVFTLSRG